MAIDFPNSPTVNDTYTAGGKTWQWTGTYWSAYGTSPILRASDTAPLSPNANDLWYETDTGSLFAYVDGYWVELGASSPVTASAGDLIGTTLASNVVSSSLTSVGTLGSLAVTGDVTVDTNTLKVDSTNNRVGIGTATPAYTLDVNGTIEGTQFLQGTDYLSPYQGFRNKIINGGFNIWQRATSFSAPANVAYTADRWASIWGTAQRTYSRVAGFSNFQYALRLARDTGSTNTGNSGLVQAFETADCYQLQGKTVTLSFYARCGSAWTTASSQLSVTAYTGTGTDQSVSTWYTPGWTGQANPLNSTATLTTTAQRFTYTFTVASNATQLIIYLNSAYVGTATANDYFEITGVQLEEGSVATPFEQRPIGTELALCQRYFYTSSDLRIVGGVYSTSVTYAPFRLPVPMRVTPSVTGNTTSNTYYLNPSGTFLLISAVIVQAGLTTDSAVLILTTGQPSYSAVSIQATGIQVSAEL